MSPWGGWRGRAPPPTSGWPATALEVQAETDCWSAERANAAARAVCYQTLVGARISGSARRTGR